ncbi:unnamed protein product [Danaus chrysippus]|uniref:(African queen) hypothetical protein n=1 Tax=Danaus chrysippus TaxID=151541 RepID=A0A8J2R359_9NEOP|nr:unnamed protein product [Danaus chrysippus]
MHPNRPMFGSHSDTSAINMKHLVTDLFSQMRDPSPGAQTPKGSTGSLNVTKNVGFQLQNGSEHLPWSNPAISLPGNCNTNLTNESGLVRSLSNASALTSLCADLSPSDSHFFEVLYIGKVRISQRKVPESLIDDALNKFAQHEAEKARASRRHSLLSSSGVSQDSNDSSKTSPEKAIEEFRRNNYIMPSTTPLEPDKNVAWKSAENLPKQESNEIDEEFDEFTKERVEIVKKIAQLEPAVVVINVTKNNLGTLTEDEEKQENLDGNDTTKKVQNTDSSKNNDHVNKLIDPLLNKPLGTNKIDENNRESKLSFGEIPRKPNKEKKQLPENKPFLRDRSASIGALSLKTPIAHLIGEQNRTMLFQVGRSELRLISPDRKQILLHRAFKDVASCVLGRSNKEHFGFVCRETNDTYACYVFKCESDSVANEVVSAIKQAFVAHAELLKKTRDKSPNMTCEHCPMLWYHRLCHDIEGMNEKKTHAFILRRIEQLPDEEQDIIITKYQGGTNHMYEVIEHNAFLMMLLRAHCESKQKRHVHDTAENRSEFLNQYLGGSTIFMKAKRSLSSGFDHLLKRRQSKDDGNLLQVPRKDISLSPAPASIETDHLESTDNQRKSISPGHEPPVPKEILTQEENDNRDDSQAVNSPMMDIFLKVSDNRSTATGNNGNDSTWRQAIYEKVLQPNIETEDHSQSNQRPSQVKKRTKEELRQLWKMAIDQTILLVRMEKENQRLKEGEESSAVRRIKLEYTELDICEPGVSLMWDDLLSRDRSHPVAKIDRHMLTQAVRQGVPRMSRGGVWYILAEQACLRIPPPDVKQFPLYNTPYNTLLSGLTKHQHAILIDLGRTFPNHSYFSSALGPGQLSLYNILKAYSLLDPQMEEAEAFALLRHLMFRRGIRKQYLPDMSALQVQLYQLSRLVRDREPELHKHLEDLDISPALYAAPWMLTLFTSQFPLGFVVRVFDLIFLESFDVVFSLSLSLLSVHKDGLLLCDSCEEAAEYLKHKLPDMNKGVYDKVMRMVAKLDISRQLTEYEVEYSVLREEMPRLALLTEQNKQLVKNTARMKEEIDSAMNAIENYQKTQTNLENQNKIMEQHLTLLSRYISAHKQDLPPEIKKIAHIYSKKLSFSSKIITKFTSNDDESDKKTYKQGISAPDLFAKTTREEIMDAMKNDERKSIKKSQSVHLLVQKHYPLKILEEKTEKTQKDSLRIENLANETIRDLGKKSSGYITNTHEQIQQERLFERQLKHDFDENLRKLDEKLTPKSYIDDISIFQSKKSMSLNLTPKIEKSDSGFVTPMSPTDNKNDNSSLTSHPLSDCDVDIKFDGQLTKLKQIRPIRSNN